MGRAKWSVAGPGATLVMTKSGEKDDVVRAWNDAIARPQVALGLEAIYLGVTEEVEAKGPACWASGRCCNFEKTGHLLYVTGLEVAYLWSQLRGAAERSAHPTGRGGWDEVQVQWARERGNCPFLERNICGVHRFKPLGCRVYFCDRSAQSWQQELSERALTHIRELHDRHGVPYRYGEWRAMLGMFARR